MSSQQQEINIDMALDTLDVMRKQENNGYVVTDYLAQIPAASAMEGAPVDATCRQVMAKWCIDIAEFCHYSLDTACVAVSILDRFMANDGSVLLDRDQFQLAAMTALYTAVKIHEHEAMDPNLVSQLSRGAHSPDAVEKMEQRMLTAVQWKVNPPTPLSFVKTMLDIVPKHLIDDYERDLINELAKEQISMTITDYHFCQYSASSVAFSALVNAVESVTRDRKFLAQFEETMSRTMNISLSSIRDLRIRLYEVIEDEMGDEPMDMVSCENNDDIHRMEAEEYTASKTQSIHRSPRSVSA